MIFSCLIYLVVVKLIEESAINGFLLILSAKQEITMQICTSLYIDLCFHCSWISVVVTDAITVSRQDIMLTELLDLVGYLRLVVFIIPKMFL